MTQAVNDQALDTTFRTARSQNKWLEKPVSTTLLLAVYDLMRFGPTSANCSPARIVFLLSRESKERLRPHLHEYNVEKSMTAPAVAIVAYDLDFPDKMGKLFPHNPGAKDWFSDPVVRRTNAFRNGSLQGAYFILAARMLGLDCGPMSGFDNEGVDREFFGGTNVKSNFLCGVGHGDPSGIYSRSPRLDFDEACRIL
jgi:3-hydroxypropanoate dehydrogenase